jgi:predicted Zn-dependent protease
VTGRKQLAFFDQESMLQLGTQAYQEALSKVKISRDPQQNELVGRIGKRIARAAEQDPEVKGYQWEFTVIDDDETVNAWALPGGKVAVYTGLIKLSGSEAELAAAMGHEIAHVTAHHGDERLSQNVLLQGGQQALAAALQSRDGTLTNLAMGAFGLGANLGVVLPFSRKQEAEADRIGLIYMARAGYDPRESLEFWKKMEAKAASGQPPTFLSTHPSHEQRIEGLQKWMDEALAIYRRESPKT